MNLTAPERAALGLSIAGCRNVLAACVEACPSFANLEPQHQAIIFMDCWLGLQRTIRGPAFEPRDVDWDKIFAFIERILPLILRIFGL